MSGLSKNGVYCNHINRAGLFRFATKINIMALMKFGAIVVDGSGKLGGHVFSKNRGGNYLRTKTTPVNPQTAAQTEVRSIFAQISSQWSGLSEAQLQSWEDRQAEYARTNIFGDLKNPNGKALFQRLNQNLLLAGKPILQVCPSSTSVISPNISAIGAKASAPGNSVDYDNDASGMEIIISATPPVSAGTSYVKNKLRIIQYAAGADGTGSAVSVDFTNSYSAKFGALAQNQIIYVKVQSMNANGQKSPGQVFRLVVGA